MPKMKNKNLPDPDGQNKDRAKWAGVGLAAFQSMTGTDDGDALKDLLCNLMHYCDQNGQDFDAALDAGRRHHEQKPRKATSPDLKSGPGLLRGETREI